ncbi:tudor domain-containing protein 1-like isoform X2 [Periplaneta americana]|uniref:tudor domain-containing protein 1-like isoform X2 n=1 Tax=Periplaneta americana TaxID=6978 RepID=UPI0037E8C0B9
MSRRSSLLQQECSNWDPMMEDFYDPNFNCYSHGPGSRLDRQLQPCYSRVDHENPYKLHIRNIPGQLSETGIRNIFLTFGKPLEIYRHPPGSGPGWAFVSYATHREAELAIRNLNNTPPFYFKVQFARSPAEKERLRLEKENDELLMRVLESEPYPVHSDRVPILPFNRGIGRGRGVPLSRPLMVNAYHPGQFQHLGEIDVDEDDDEDMGYYSHHVPGIYEDTNRMVMQGLNLTVNSAAGKRRVSMGRGYYPVNERPVNGQVDVVIKKYNEEENTKLMTNLEKYYEREKNGFYEYGEKVDTSDVSGNCLCCGKMTTHCCQRCFGWYCTRECQVKDWPLHKSNCIPLPAFGEAVKLPGGQRNDINDQNSRNGKENSKTNEQNFKTDACEDESSISEVSNIQDQNRKRSYYKDNQGTVNSKDNHYYRSHDSSSTSHNYDSNKRRSDSQFGDGRKGQFRSSDGHAAKPQGSVNNRNIWKNETDTRKSNVNERLHIAKQPERNSTNHNRIPSQVQELSDVQTSPNTWMKERNPTETASSTPNKPLKEERAPISAVSLGVSEKAFSKPSRKSFDLPKDTFSKVKISVPLENLEYWVQAVDMEEKLLEVMGALLEITDSSPAGELRIGAICAALYDNLWYRVEVLATEPKVKVHYVDFGNEEICTSDQLKALPSSIKDIPYLCQKIQLHGGTSKKYHSLSADEIISVKPVGETVNGVTIVHVEGEKYEPVAVPQPCSPDNQTKLVSTSPNRTSDKYTPLPRPKQRSDVQVKEQVPIAVEGLKIGMSGGGEFKKQLADDDCTITIVYPEIKEKFTKLCIEFCKACENAPVDPYYKPSVGELVAAYAQVGSAQDGITWNRAHILAVGNSGYRVKLCDVGLIANVKTVKKLPQDFISVPEVAAKCSIINFTKPKESLWSEQNKRFLFTVTQVDEVEKTATCILQSVQKEELCKAVFRHWVPSVQDEGLKMIELKNNDMVSLSVVFDQKSLFVRSASKESKDMLNQTVQDVGMHCMKAPSLDRMPNKNELLACRFSLDGNYYRVKVLGIEKDRILVTYIDFGNNDCVTQDKLKALPENLKKIPCMAVKICLKDVLDKPLTKDASTLLSKFIAGEVEMKLVLKGSYRDGVELILPDGSLLSNVVNEMLEPGWKKDLKSGKNPAECKVFKEEDIKYVELPTGETVDFLVLHKLDSVNITGCEANGKVMTYVHTTMSEELNQYCASTTEKSYVPRLSEVCLAKYEDGLWYRAMCIADDSSKQNNVIFLDFGNMAYVEKTNIRKMVPDYMEIPAVAVLCTLKDLETANDAQKKCVEELLQVNKVYTANIISSACPGTYVIEFPHVTNALKKENLLTIS